MTVVSGGGTEAEAAEEGRMSEVEERRRERRVKERELGLGFGWRRGGGVGGGVIIE